MLVVVVEERGHFDYLLLDLIRLLSLKLDLELVVDEGESHALLELDQVRGHVLLHLLQTLQEDVGSIG